MISNILNSDHFVRVSPLKFNSSVRKNRTHPHPDVDSRTDCVYFRGRFYSFVGVVDRPGVRVFLPVCQSVAGMVFCVYILSVTVINSFHQQIPDLLAALHCARYHSRNVEVEDRSGQLGHSVLDGARRSVRLQSAGHCVPIPASCWPAVRRKPSGTSNWTTG